MFLTGGGREPGFWGEEGHCHRKKRLPCLEALVARFH